MKIQRLSVVIAFRNGAAFLPAAVRSVLAQHVPVEIILVDDGSTDDAPTIARALVDAHPAILTLAHQRNQGAAAARNLGLRLVSSQYVCFLDVDDEFAPGYFVEALATLDHRPDAVAVYPLVELVELHRPVHPLQMAMIECSISASLVSRTAAIRKIGGYPVEPALRGRVGGEDALLRAALARCGEQVLIPHPYYRYRVQPGGHLDFFLDRTAIEDGKVVFTSHVPEEENGELGATWQRYLAQVAARELDGLAQSLPIALEVAAALVDGPNDDDAMMALLGWLLPRLPGEGCVVALGITDGAPSRWLGRAGRGRLIVTDGQAPADWHGAIRLLLFDAACDFATAVQRAESWLPHVESRGLLVFYGLETALGGREVYEQLRGDRRQLEELGRAAGLGVLRRVEIEPE